MSVKREGGRERGEAEAEAEAEAETEKELCTNIPRSRHVSVTVEVTGDHSHRGVKALCKCAERRLFVGAVILLQQQLVLAAVCDENIVPAPVIM